MVIQYNNNSHEEGANTGFEKIGKRENKRASP